MSAALVVVGVFAVLAAFPQPVRNPHPVDGASTADRLDGWLRARLERGGLEHLVTRPAQAWCGAAVASGLAGALLGGVGGFVAGFVVGAVALPVLVAARGDRTPQRIVAQLPEMLEQMASNLRAGATVRDALGRAAPPSGPLASDVATLFFASSNGVSMTNALDEWAKQRALPEVRVVATMLTVGIATGTDLSSSCDQAAAVMRQQAHLGQEIAALATQARASAIVIGSAPLAFLVVAAAAGSSPTVLFSSPVGAAALVGGLLLDVVGLLWMRRIVAGVTP